MSSESKPVSINILDKEYLITCEESEREQLHTAAEYLNSKLIELKGSGKVIGSERIAVMTALNLASELLQYKQENNDYTEQVDKTIKRLYSKLNGVLEQENRLPI